MNVDNVINTFAYRRSVRDVSKSLDELVLAVKELSDEDVSPIITMAYTGLSNFTDNASDAWKTALSFKANFNEGKAESVIFASTLLGQEPRTFFKAEVIGNTNNLVVVTDYFENLRMAVDAMTTANADVVSYLTFVSYSIFKWLHDNNYTVVAFYPTEDVSVFSATFAMGDDLVKISFDHRVIKWDEEYTEKWVKEGFPKEEE
jgi:hypothetical protein